MKAQQTRDFLKIFWHSDEVDGITFYAYTVKNTDGQPAFPLEGWPDGTQIKTFKLKGDGWLVWAWDVRIEEWPGKWIDALRSTLLRLTDSGASVAWCGLEGCFADPPELLSSSAMADGVYAAASRSTGFICHTDLNRPFQTISESEMLALKSQLK